jgi:parvulin-like peptidyl-prolyl isomerase
MTRLVFRTLGPRLCAVIIFVLSSACAHRPTSGGAAAATPAATAQGAAITGAGPVASAPSLIELRVLTVAYKQTQPVLDRTREQAQQRAQMLASLAREGEHLSQLVGEYSDRPGANSDRGVVKLRVAEPAPFDEALVRVALALPVGGVSEPLDQPEGFVIIERLKDPPPGPERISAKHILIGYADSPKSVGNVTRSEAEAAALADQVRKAAVAPDADWDALAAQYTDEEAGKKSGGDLGSFGRGQMVPAFERAAFALEVGQTSEVIKSPFGFHIIRRYK